MHEGAFSYFSAPFQAFELAEVVREAMASPCWDDGIEVLSATPDWVRLAARCDTATANRLVHFIHGVKDPSIPEADRENVVAAFREILMNAMEHGGNFDSSQYVEISFVRTRREVVGRSRGRGTARWPMKRSAPQEADSIAPVPFRRFTDERAQRSD